jgi:glycosyltransferase involved in cell wall biosynthesis
VPAYNEEELILKTLNGIPNYVDTIFIIDDGSNDQTPTLCTEQQKKDYRLKIIKHRINQGLGQSLIDGYIASAESEVDITVVMAGDDQMHPEDLPLLLNEIIDNDYDYVKGNRLLHQDIKIMPAYRFLGNSFLTIMTKFATGFYFLMDPQCGYTAIKNSALRRIPISEMSRGYGYNADILCMLNIQGFRVTDVEVRPVYGNEKSKIKLIKYIPHISLNLIRLFFMRLWRRYVILDFNPLVLFYLFGIFNTFFIIFPFIIRFFYMYCVYKEFPKTTMSILIFTFLITFQSILFAIWMDMDYNKR